MLRLVALLGLALALAAWRRRRHTVRDALPREELPRLLTVVVTTSPSPIHPSTELIDALFASIARYAAELLACRTIVVCDGYKVAKRVAFRSGKVDAAAAARYAEYKRHLRAVAAAGERFELLELEENHGFGFAVRRALEEVRTPLVCVIQHDRTFLRTVALEPIARRMLLAAGAVGYVLLPTRSTARYVHQQSSRLGAHGIKHARGELERLAIPLHGEGESLGAEGGGRLLPCLQWYDSTHLALTSYYREFVFNGAEKLVTQGKFIEAELGQVQFQEMCSKGIAASLPRWRTYLLDDVVEAPIVGHMNGSNGCAHEVLVSKCQAEGIDPSKVMGRLGRTADNARGSP
ncbi:hypothetical protein AB1Y20_017515 [Prymnesium parvum]|uniref:Uncharacterized protein n=1 Tax=Prymnesium parvum TaxID=97485 RepID=A0AB34JLH9_PRYPA